MDKNQNICRASIPNKWDFTHRLPNLSVRDFRKASDTIGDMNLPPNALYLDGTGSVHGLIFVKLHSRN